MRISLTFKRMVGLAVAALPILTQSLYAHTLGEPLKECQGIQSKIEFMGTKLTRDLKQNKDKLASTEVTISAANEIENPALISRSQSYNPAVEFFRKGLDINCTSIQEVLRTENTPPNPSGAAGPEQYIFTTNQYIQSLNRRTGVPDGVIDSTTSYFFGQGSISDPHIFYDHFAKVWYVIAMKTIDAFGAVSVVFAVGRDCVITECTEWDFYNIPVEFLAPGIAARLDYPLMSYDSEAVYMALDILNSTVTVPLGTSLVVLQKESLLKGNPLVTIFPLVNPNPSDSSDVPFFCAPAINFDLHPEYGYFIHKSLGFSDQIYTQLHLLRIENPGSSQPTLAPPSAIDVPPYANVAAFTYPPVAGNAFPYPYNTIAEAAVITTAMVRGNQLYVAPITYTDASGEATLVPDRLGIEWYQIDLTGDRTGCGRGVETPITTPVCIQSGLIYDDAPTNFNNYFVGSVAVNKLGDMVVTGTVYGSVDFTNVFYSARKRKDPLNTLRNPVLITNNTTNPFNYGPLAGAPGTQRWGDMSSIYVDPCNDLNFWITGMYAGLPNGWSIRTTELIRTNN